MTYSIKRRFALHFKMTFESLTRLAGGVKAVQGE